MQPLVDHGLVERQPDPEDRRAILKIYDGKMKLRLTEDAIEYAVRRTNDFVLGAGGGTRYSGDHLNALCRAIARLRLREDVVSETNQSEANQKSAPAVERGLFLVPKVIELHDPPPSRFAPPPQGGAPRGPAKPVPRVHR